MATKSVRGPLPAFGSYRVTHRFALANAQAAASRLFELRNAHASNLLVLQRLRVFLMQTGAHTAAIANDLAVFCARSFSVVDTTNTVTLTGVRKRTSTMPAAPGGALIRGVTVAGAAAGMTGGTLTLDAEPIAQAPIWHLLALPTAGPVPTLILEVWDENVHPFVLEPNEGIVVQNQILLGAAAASRVSVEVDWSEVRTF